MEVLKKEERISLKYGRRKKKEAAQYKILKKELGLKEIEEARFTKKKFMLLAAVIAKTAAFEGLKFFLMLLAAVIAKTATFKG